MVDIEVRRSNLGLEEPVATLPTPLEVDKAIKFRASDFIPYLGLENYFKRNDALLKGEGKFRDVTFEGEDFVRLVNRSLLRRVGLMGYNVANMAAHAYGIYKGAEFLKDTFF